MSLETSTEQALPESAPEFAKNGGDPASEKAQTALELDEIRWRPVLALPCELTVDLALPGFKVSDLLKLQVGSLIGSQWHVTRDVPLRINGTVIAWSEFEVVGSRLAVRLTELA